MKPETIAKLIAGCTTDDERSAAISRAIEQEKSVKRRLFAQHRKSEAEETRHETVEEALSVELSGIHDSCPHLETTYHGDPSGGSDSLTSCDCCGKELPR